MWISNTYVSKLCLTGSQLTICILCLTNAPQSKFAISRTNLVLLDSFNTELNKTMVKLKVKNIIRVCAFDFS